MILPQNVGFYAIRVNGMLYAQRALCDSNFDLSIHDAQFSLPD
jgi:hypothetical protein